MLELQRLRADHEAAVLGSELLNRSYVAGSVSDRGDAYAAQLVDPAEVRGKPGDPFERRLAPARPRRPGG